MAASSVRELERRVEQVEQEIRTLKILLSNSICPPTTEFEKTIDLSLKESEPFFREIAKILTRETTQTNANGVAVLAGLYQNDKTDQRTWWAARQSIEALLAQKDQAYQEASALAKSLSSNIRLRILVDLCYGPRRFGELVAATGVRGGQLTHHLQPLVSQNLIQKREDKYSLTIKGWQSLFALLLANQKETRGQHLSS